MSGHEATMFGNWFKTSLLMAAIMALFGVVGAMLGGAQGMLLALAFGLATNLWAYWYSDTMVLKLYRAHEVDATSAPQLYDTVKRNRTRSRPDAILNMLRLPRRPAFCNCSPRVNCGAFSHTSLPTCETATY